MIRFREVKTLAKASNAARRVAGTFWLWLSNALDRVHLYAVAGRNFTSIVHVLKHLQAILLSMLPVPASTSLQPFLVSTTWH